MRLRRVLVLRDLIVVAAASMGPAFSLATTMAAMVAAAGRWTWLALLLVAVLMAMIALGYKRLGERWRDAGSSYAWIRAAFGPEAGAYGAWVLLVANVFAVLATALPAGAYTLDLIAPALAANEHAVALVACAWIVGTAVLLWYGLRPTALLAFALLAAEVLILAAAAALAGAHPRPDAVAFTRAPLEWDGLVAAMVVGIWMIDGWEVSASTAEEAEGAPSVPGWGGLAGLVLTTAVLLAANLFQTEMGAIGLTVSLVGVSQGDLIGYAIFGLYQVMTWAQFGGVSPDLNYPWFSTKTHLNFANNNDPTVEKLMLQGMAASTEAARVKAWSEVSAQINKDVPYLWTDRVVLGVAAKSYVQNWKTFDTPAPAKPVLQPNQAVLFFTTTWRS